MELPYILLIIGLSIVLAVGILSFVRGLIVAKLSVLDAFDGSLSTMGMGAFIVFALMFLGAMASIYNSLPF